MRHAIVWAGLGLIVVTVAVVVWLFAWVPVVLLASGSRSDARFMAAFGKLGIELRGGSSIGIMEIEVRRVHAGMVSDLARSIDPTGKKIVVTWPDYPDVKSSSSWIPRDDERP